tara:strand:+ start:80564 stop:81139 length:576 start_codon:yes stop_codon:yes gene_type:complete
MILEMKSIFTTVVSVFLLVAANMSWSANIGCGSTQRWAELDSATLCKTGEGNTNGNGSTINTLFGPTWTQQGSNDGSNGTSGFLTTDADSWGQHVTGTWAIDASFWSLFGEAIISIHVGNGGGSPDHFAWTIETGATSGTFSYDKLTGGGGGLSNMKLWSRGAPTTVPEPGSIALLGLGLVGLVASRRKQR